jgi:hypothetical protein
MSILRPESGQKSRVPHANPTFSHQGEGHLNLKGNADAALDDGFWQQHLGAATYQYPELDYARDYKPAYQLVLELYVQQGAAGRFDDAVNGLEARWEASKGQSRLDWQQAKAIIVEAWNTLMNKGLDMQHPH